MSQATSLATSPDRADAEPGSAIVVSHLMKTYKSDRGAPAAPRAVDDLSLRIEVGEFFTLLGPSGCGKTTTLRSIAGLESPDSGEIELAGRRVYSSRDRIDLPSNQRRIGMVFQSYAIWPHMSVFENVAFPLRVEPRRLRRSRAEIAEMVERVLDVVELAPYAQRSATQLSGGQQQRLALARAMVASPEVLLLDEPLSNLDAKLRDAMRVELKRLQARSGFTAVYVTHDQTEALAMSSRIAIMQAGVIQQIGAPREIYTHPANEFVAGFIGRMNFVEARVDRGPEADDDLHVVDARLGIPILARSPERIAAGTPVTLCVRPEGIKISARSEGSAPRAHGVVRSAQFLGEQTEYIVHVQDSDLLIRADAEVQFPRGSDVDVELLPSATWLLRK